MQNCEGHTFYAERGRLKYNILHITFLLLAPLPTSGGFTNSTTSIQYYALRFEGLTASFLRVT
jgi:hypothetical protein